MPSCRARGVGERIELPRTGRVAVHTAPDDQGARGGGHPPRSRHRDSTTSRSSHIGDLEAGFNDGAALHRQSRSTASSRARVTLRPWAGSSEAGPASGISCGRIGLPACGWPFRRGTCQRAEGRKDAKPTEDRQASGATYRRRPWGRDGYRLVEQDDAQAFRASNAPSRCRRAGADHDDVHSPSRPHAHSWGAGCRDAQRFSSKRARRKKACGRPAVPSIRAALARPPAPRVCSRGESTAVHRVG